MYVVSDYSRAGEKMIEVFKALGLTLIFGGVVIAILTITALKKNNGR